MTRNLIFTLVMSTAATSWAHDEWANGQPVPSWIKAACCGESEAHLLRPDQVHRVSDDFYRVDGYPRTIPVSHALPSEDGRYWLFYGWVNGEPDEARCFFVPMDF